MKDLKDKITQKLLPLYQKLDVKLTSLIPNTKLRKIIIISLAGFIVFFVLLLILGVIISSTRPREDTSFTLNKPSITNLSPEPISPKTQTQQNLMNLKNEINSLKFPPSKLNVPSIEKGLNLND